jgi:hypothetical protein
MSTELKPWHKAQCDLILAEMRSPPVSSTSSHPTPATEPPESPTGKEEEDGEEVFTI